MSNVRDYLEFSPKLGNKVFVDPTAIMFLIGAEMDYVEDKRQSGFVFNNPNEKGRCGCGESFNI